MDQPDPITLMRQVVETLAPLSRTERDLFFASCDQQLQLEDALRVATTAASAPSEIPAPKKRAARKPAADSTPRAKKPALGQNVESVRDRLRTPDATSGDVLPPGPRTAA